MDDASSELRRLRTMADRIRSGSPDWLKRSPSFFIHSSAAYCEGEGSEEFMLMIMVFIISGINLNVSWCTLVAVHFRIIQQWHPGYQGPFLGWKIFKADNTVRIQSKQEFFYVGSCIISRKRWICEEYYIWRPKPIAEKCMLPWNVILLKLVASCR